MPSNRRHTPYRERILYFCATHGVVVPRNFDVSQPSARYALIDVTTEPWHLMPRTTFLRKEIAAFLKSTAGAERRYRILDFRSGREFQIAGDGTFAECARFQAAPPGELLYLVAP